MRAANVLRLAHVLVASQLRGSGRDRPATSLLGKPRVLLYVDLAGFIAPLVLLLTVLKRLPFQLGLLLWDLTAQALVGLPVFVTSTLLLIGVLWEIAAPYRFTSSDTVNWLPLRPSEYVLASTLSSVYTYSILLAVGWGATLGLALTFRMELLWVVSALVSLVAALIGGFAVEMLRSLTNRVSSSFYRRGGRGVIAVRLVLTVLALVLFQVIFNANLMLPLVQALVGAVNAFWFIPVLWPALLVQRLYESDLLGAAALAGAIPVFTAALFFAAVALRTRYWAPLPVSIRVTNTVYAPRAGLLGRLGLSPVEAAIVRKDLRSLTRRREMARFLALPIALFIPFTLTFSNLSAEPVDRVAFGLPLIVPLLALFSLILAMASIGQEGQAVLNLYASPISPRQLLGGKLLSSLLVSTPFNVAFAALMLWAGGVQPDLFGGFIAVTVALTVESAFLGLAVGCWGPDFSEGPRTRFVAMKGWVVGQLAFWGAAAVSEAPVALYVYSPSLAARIGVQLPTAVAVAVTVTALISSVAYKYASRAATRLLQESRV
ncbi:MAG: hypothetical protein QW057_04170 [Candidatus Bathyarchaeia archaeon]